MYYNYEEEQDGYWMTPAFGALPPNLCGTYFRCVASEESADLQGGTHHVQGSPSCA